MYTIGAPQTQSRQPLINTTTVTEIEVAAVQAQAGSTPNNHASDIEMLAVAPQDQIQEPPRLDRKLLRAILDEDVISLKEIMAKGLEASTKPRTVGLTVKTMHRFVKTMHRIADKVEPFCLSIFGTDIAQNRIDKFMRKKIVQQTGNEILDPEELLGSSHDVNSAPVTTEQNGLRGVTSGKNNALHIVGGVMESRPPNLFWVALPLLLQATSLPESILAAMSLTSSKNYLWVLRVVVTLAGFLLFLFSLIFPLSFTLNYVSDLEIAEIIYREDPALLLARNHAMETPLLCAAKAGKHTMVLLFIKLVDERHPQKLEEVLWARNQFGETALHEASRLNYSYVVKILVGADKILANLLDNSGTSPLYLAAASGSLSVVRVLIGCNPKVSYLGPHGQTALHAAVMRPHKHKRNVRSMIHEILEWDPALATIADELQNTPLHYAASVDNVYAARKILSKNPEAAYNPNSLGSYPVHLAAEAGSFGVVKEILRECPDAGELLDKKQRNFLHIAVEKEREQLVMSAIRNGILNGNLRNAQDEDGNTPLHLAVKKSDLGIVTLLSRDNVNPNIRNAEGLTPLDISASMQDHRFTYSLNPQSMIHSSLILNGAFQNPCQSDSSKIADNPIARENGAEEDWPSRRGEKESRNVVGIDIEKESTKYENMSKSLITGAVLIASAAFGAIFTVSGVYKGDDTSHTWINRNNVFKAFIIANVLAFICAIVSTTWLLYSALTNFHLKYRKFYFEWCIPILYGAINLFILTFGLGGYIAIAPRCEWLGIVIFVVSGIAIIWNIIWNPQLVPLILLAPYIRVEPYR